MKCLAGMLAVLWVAAAQSQTPALEQPPTAAPTPTIEPTAAPVVAQEAAAVAPKAEQIAAPAVAQEAVATAPTPDGAESAVAQPVATPAETAAAQALDSTTQSRAPMQTAAATATTPAAAATSGGSASVVAPPVTATPAVAVTPAAAVTPADVAQARDYLKSAAEDFTNCVHPAACNVYFDTFGVAIPFADGSIVPFSHVQRLKATSRACIKKAKALAEEGNRSLAVQWAMAARIEDRSVRDWLGDHPDAVLAALRQMRML